MTVAEMRFFDVNTMIGGWNNYDLAFKTADGLAAEMRRVHIEKALAYHSMALCSDPKNGNDALARALEGHPDIVGAMVLTPLIREEFGGRDAVAGFMREHRIGAVRLFPNEHSYTLEEWNAEELFELTDEFSVPVLIDFRSNGGYPAEYYDQIYRLARRWPNTPIVLLSVGYRYLRVILKLLEKCPNVSVGTDTFIAYRGIEEIVKYCGSTRVLFASRMPFLESGVSVGRVLYADLSDADKENIAYNNAAALINGNRLYGGS